MFCGGKDPYDYEMEGANYFDMDCEKSIGNGHLVLFGDGEKIEVTTGKSLVRFLLFPELRFMKKFPGTVPL
jgi:hypothetical protein